MALNEQQRKWVRNIRDSGECQFPYDYKNKKGRLQVHHITPQRLGGADEPENLISLDETIHPGVIHPDVFAAKVEYAKGNKNAFDEMRQRRNEQIRSGEKYYNDTYDEEFRVIARHNTQNAALDKQFFPRKPGSFFIPEFDPHTEEMVLLQHDQRKNWLENDTEEVVASMILDELQELDEAVVKAQIGDGPFEVVSEIGDIGYLFIRYKSMNGEMNEQLSQALEYCHYICEATGIVWDQAIMMKIWRNSLKYPTFLSNNGYTYAKSVQISKEQWRLLGGDQAFYIMYEEVID